MLPCPPPIKSPVVPGLKAVRYAAHSFWTDASAWFGDSGWIQLSYRWLLLLLLLYCSPGYCNCISFFWSIFCYSFLHFVNINAFSPAFVLPSFICKHFTIVYVLWVFIVVTIFMLPSLARSLLKTKVFISMSFYLNRTEWHTDITLCWLTCKRGMLPPAKSVTSFGADKTFITSQSLTLELSWKLFTTLLWLTEISTISHPSKWAFYDTEHMRLSVVQF